MDHGDEIIIPEPFYASTMGFLPSEFGCSRYLNPLTSLGLHYRQ
jgi:hypothetical protein